MARQKIQPITCWKIQYEGLSIYLASSEKGALRIGMSLKETGEATDYFQQLFPGRELIVDEAKNQPLIEAVRAALEGRHGTTEGSLSLDIKGTPFQLQVWKTLLEIPYGETRTYGQVAKMVDRPRGARAVGQAVGANPLPLFFP